MTSLTPFHCDGAHRIETVRGTREVFWPGMMVPPVAFFTLPNHFACFISPVHSSRSLWTRQARKFYRRLCAREHKTKKQGKLQRTLPLEAKVLVSIMMSVSVSNRRAEHISKKKSPETRLHQTQFLYALPNTLVSAMEVVPVSFRQHVAL